MQAHHVRLGAAAAAVLLAAAPAGAHHAIGSVVDTGRTLTTPMVLTKIDWINPHAWFHFSMTKADGSVVKDVAVEWMGISGLRQRGYTGPESFAVGRMYTVAYYPNRDGSPGGHLVSMVDQASETVVGRAPIAQAIPVPQATPAPVPVPLPRPRYSVLGNDDL
jgi:hypothetical protein